MKILRLLLTLSLLQLGCQSPPPATSTPASSETPLSGPSLATLYVQEVEIKDPTKTHLPESFEQRLRVFQLTPEGKLNKGPTYPLGTAANCQLLAVAATRTLVETDSEHSQARAYNITADGSLKADQVISNLPSGMPYSMLPLGEGKVLATDGAGYLVLENSGPGKLELLSSGKIPVSHSGPRSPYEFAYDPINHCLWTASEKDAHSLTSMILDAKNNLQAGPQVQLKFAPGSLTIDEKGEAAYVYGDSAMHRLSIQQGARMQETGSAPTKGEIFDVHYEPKGKHLVCVSTSGTFHIFTADAKGQLKAGVPFEAHKMLPMNRLQADPSGRYLISVSEGIRVLRYTDQGSLELVSSEDGIYNALAIFAGN